MDKLVVAHWLHRVILPALLLCSSNTTLADLPDARQLLSQGKDRFANGDFAEARRLLLEAAGRSRASDLLSVIHLHLGCIHAAERRTAEALAAFRTALTHDPNLQLDPRRYKEAFVRLFAAARRSTVGELLVSVDPPDSEVIVDGVVVGKGSFRGHVIAGAHRIEVRVAGQPPRTRTVQVSAGQSARVDIWGGGFRSVSPPPPPPPPPPVTTPKPRRRLWTWIVAGGAVASLAVGVGVRLSASRDYDEGCSLLASAALPCGERSHLLRPEDRPRYEELQRSVRVKDLTATVAFGVAAALAVAAPLLYWLEGRARPRSERARVHVSGPTGAATLQLAF